MKVLISDNLAPIGEKILREAGIVTDRREGQQVHYSINRGVVAGCCEDFCDCLDVSGAAKKNQKKK